MEKQKKKKASILKDNFLLAITHPPTVCAHIYVCMCSYVCGVGCVCVCVYVHTCAEASKELSKEREEGKEHPFQVSCLKDLGASAE